MYEKDSHCSVRKSPRRRVTWRGLVLLLGQLHSGGWYYRIEFDQERRTRFDYRYSADGQRTSDPLPPAQRKVAQGWHIWRRRKYKGNQTIIDDMDERGAWVEKRRLRHHKAEPASGIIDCGTFIANVNILCQLVRLRAGDAGGE